MRRLASKLRSRSGESFAEVLVAILVIAMAALLMASMVSASGGIDMATRKMDDKFYDAVSALETGDHGTDTTTINDATVTVTEVVTGTSTSITLDAYSQDGLIAYE